MPFERRSISQSFRKCDHSLSQESIRKARYFKSVFFFLQQITGIFIALLGEWYGRVECGSVNSTANLSTWRHLTNQSMIPESCIMEQRHRSKLSPGSAALPPTPPPPITRQPHGSLGSAIFFLFDPVFCLLPPTGWNRKSRIPRKVARLIPENFGQTACFLCI